MSTLPLLDLDSPKLSDTEFHFISELLESTAGIHLSLAKKPLVIGRLGKRLRQYNLTRFDEYFALLRQPAHKEELRVAIDLLTTNETYFFREPRHFDLLRSISAAHPKGRAFRVWSAAASTGQEAHSIAMVLADVLGETPWDVVGTDISDRVLHTARAGRYPLDQAGNVPDAYLKKYCLKGVGQSQGIFMLDPKWRRRINFSYANLTSGVSGIGSFDVVFLRNVLIYFQPEVKRLVVERVVANIRPGGLLFIGHSESLHGITNCVRVQQPTVYRKDE